jgi:hypothetical protein
MNAQHAKPYQFDAGPTDLFPGSCLSQRRHPEYPAAQAPPHTPALGCGGGRRHYSDCGSGPNGKEDALRQTPNRPNTKGSPMKSNRPQFSWWLRSATHNDGRRVISLWRSPSVNCSQSSAVNSPRAVHLKAGVKLRVQFTRESPPVPVQVVVRGGQVAVVPGPVGGSLANWRPSSAN